MGDWMEYKNHGEIKNGNLKYQNLWRIPWAALKIKFISRNGNIKRGVEIFLYLKKNLMVCAMYHKANTNLTQFVEEKY